MTLKTFSEMGPNGAPGKQLLNEPEDGAEAQTTPLGDEGESESDDVNVFGADDQQGSGEDLDNTDSLGGEDEGPDLDSEVGFDGDEDGEDDMGGSDPETLVKDLATALAGILKYQNGDDMSDEEAMQESVLAILGEDASVVRQTMQQHSSRRSGAWQASDFKDLYEDLTSAQGDFYVPTGLMERVSNDHLYYTIETSSEESGVAVVEIMKLVDVKSKARALGEAKSENTLWKQRLSNVQDVDTNNKNYAGLARTHSLRSADDVRGLVQESKGTANRFLFVSESVREGLGLQEARTGGLIKSLFTEDAATIANKTRKTHAITNTNWADMYDASIKQVAAATKLGKKAPSRTGDKTTADKMQRIQDFLNQCSSSCVEALWKASAGKSSAMTVAKEALDLTFVNEVNSIVSLDESMSQEAKDQVGLIFENAVEAKIMDVIPAVIASLEEEKRNNVQQIQEALVGRIDEYLDYTVEQFMKENEVAIDKGIELEISESLMTGMKKLFDAHYVTVPDSPRDVLESANQEVENLQGRLEESKQNSLAYKRKAVDLLRENTAYRLSKGLSDNQTAKLYKLIEDIEFSSEDEFIMKARSIRESYFTIAKPKGEIKEEDIAPILEQNEPSSSADGSTMDKYVGTIKKMNA